MALMKFREPNQVTWYGSRPAHRGTQVTKSVSTTGAASVIIHTVSASKTLFIKLLILSRNTSTGNCNIFVRNDSDVSQYTIVKNDLHTNIGLATPDIIPFDDPLEVPADWDIILNNTVAGDAFAFLFGWEE